MRVISWNMGCSPRPSKYRKAHKDAWRYFVDALQPDVGLVQESLLAGEEWAGDAGAVHWSIEKGSDSGTAIFIKHGISARRLDVRAEGSYIAAAEVDTLRGHLLVVSAHVGPGDYAKHRAALSEVLVGLCRGRSFVAGGDMKYGAPPGRGLPHYIEPLILREVGDRRIPRLPLGNARARSTELLGTPSEEPLSG